MKTSPGPTIKAIQKHVAKAQEPSIKELEETIQKAHDEIARLKAIQSGAVWSLESIPLSHKVKTFDAMFSGAKEHFDKVMRGEMFEDNDEAHYTWEAVMTGCLGPDVFKIMNARTRGR